MLWCKQKTLQFNEILKTQLPTLYYIFMYVYTQK